MWRKRRLTAQDITTAYKNHQHAEADARAAAGEAKEKRADLQRMLRQVSDALKTKGLIKPGGEALIRLDDDYFVHISYTFFDTEKRIVVPTHKLEDVI